MIAALHGTRGAALIMALLCAGLVAVVDRELRVETAAPAIARPAAPVHVAPLPPEAPSVRLPTLSALGEVVKRPLFSRMRRPAPTATPSTLGAAGTFALVGVVIDSQARQALIRHGHPPALARLAAGQSVEGWTLKTVDADRVVLAHGGTRHELRLKDHSSTPRPSPAIRHR